MRALPGRHVGIILGLSAVVVVSAIMAAVWLGVPRMFDPPKTAASFGDMFGVASALFSGLALAGVIIAIHLQSRELMLQREELRATRKELHGQMVQLSLQEKTMARQRFENTFFHHLDLLNSIIGAIGLRGGDGRVAITGRDCFEAMLAEAIHQAPVPSARHSEPLLPGAALMIGYERVYGAHNAKIGHYFRTLYNTVRYVDESDLDDKVVYMRLVRAQLSSAELALLALNCLTDRGRKFKPLVERHALLKHVSRPLAGVIADETDALLAQYDKSAFAG